MAPGKYTFMQSNLIDVKMCTFLQKHCIFEIKASSSHRLADRHLFWGRLPPLVFSDFLSGKVDVHRNTVLVMGKKEGFGAQFRNLKVWCWYPICLASVKTSTGQCHGGSV